MKPRVIDRYILGLWLGPFLGGLAVVLVVLLLTRVLRLLDDVMEASQSWGLLLDVFVLSLPYFLMLTIPVAFFISMQNTVASLQQGSEMDALRASGLSYARIFRSLFVVSCLIWTGLTFLSFQVLPKGQLEFRNLMLTLYEMKGAISLTPKRFTRATETMTIYVEGEAGEGSYSGVMLVDSRSMPPVIYLAREARFEPLGDNFRIMMRSGTRLEGRGMAQRILSFDKYEVAIPLKKVQMRLARPEDHATMMQAGQLWQKVRKTPTNEAVAELNRRLVFPMLVLALFFFALPLSLAPKRSGKAGSIIAGIAVLIAVYNIHLMVHRQVVVGTLPWWSMWAVQFAMMGVGIYLWRRAEQDRMPKILSQTGEMLYVWHQAWVDWLARRKGLAE